ncbi:MAG: serine hydrolase domain-containing protein [Myxococcota bacterium]|nr:beta-lactamase family protein [Myxococcales bacterium]
MTARGDEADAARAGVAPRAVESVWERVEALYRSGAHPAIQLSVRFRGAEVLHRAIGHARGNAPADREAGIPLAPIGVETPVNLFSAAKAVTAMIVHRLHDERVLDVDAPVASYIRDFGRCGKERITLRHVLTHRAGIPAPPPGSLDLDLLGEPEELLELLCDTEPEHDPDRYSAYHAITGGFIVAEVLRRTTGKTLRALAHELVKAPLGLAWLEYGVAPEHVGLVARNATTGPRLAAPLRRVVAHMIGAPLEAVIEWSNDPRFLTAIVPSANLVTTAHDIGVFYQCLLDDGVAGGREVFGPAAIARSRRIESRGQLDRRLLIPMAYSPGFMCGTSGLSLYGWNHPRAFGHLGLSNIFTWADPDRALVIALVTTGKPILTPHVVPLLQLLAGIHEAFPPVD